MRNAAHSRVRKARARDDRLQLRLAMTQRFGMTVKTHLSFDELDNVIGQYVQGPYEISIGRLDESGKHRRKIMIIWFDQEVDRHRMRAFFAARRAPRSGGLALAG